MLCNGHDAPCPIRQSNVKQNNIMSIFNGSLYLDHSISIFNTKHVSKNVNELLFEFSTLAATADITAHSCFPSGTRYKLNQKYQAPFSRTFRVRHWNCSYKNIII